MPIEDTAIQLIAQGVSPLDVIRLVADKTGVQWNYSDFRDFKNLNLSKIKEELKRLERNLDNLPMSSPVYKIFMLNNIIEKLHFAFEGSLEEGQLRSSVDIASAICRALRLICDIQGQIPAAPRGNVFIDKIAVLSPDAKGLATFLIHSLGELTRGIKPDEILKSLPASVEEINLEKMNKS